MEGHDWTDDRAIKRALDWPFDGLLKSVEDGVLWWPEWRDYLPLYAIASRFSTDLTDFDAMVPLIDKVWQYCEGTGNRGRTVS